MFESFEPGKTEKAKCPKKRREEKKNSTLPKTMPQAAGKNSSKLKAMQNLPAQSMELTRYTRALPCLSRTQDHLPIDSLKVLENPVRGIKGGGQGRPGPPNI